MHTKPDMLMARQRLMLPTHAMGGLVSRLVGGLVRCGEFRRVRALLLVGGPINLNRRRRRGHDDGEGERR